MIRRAASIPKQDSSLRSSDSNSVTEQAGSPRIRAGPTRQFTASTPRALAEYAMAVEQSLGRRYPEARHPYRNEYERDRDRIIHSRAFRRLENKTQVFAHRYSDHFRT